MNPHKRLSSALALCLLSAAQLFAATNTNSSTTPKMQDSWGDHHRALVQEAEDNADKIQIVLLGDSITYRWTVGAGKEIRQERYDPHGVINLGISADQIQHVLWRLENGEMAPLHPKMVLLMIGTNNLYNRSNEEIAYGVWKIVEYIRSHHPETRVLVQAIFPRSRPAGRMEQIHKINDYLAKLDDGKMVKFIDFGEVFLNPDGSLNETWFTDGLHPEKPEAFTAWADSIQAIVDQWLATAPVANVPPPSAPVETPEDLTIIQPASRNDWLYKYNRFLEETERSEGHLLFLGDITMSKWQRGLGDLYRDTYRQYAPVFGAMWGNRTENILWQLKNMPAKNIDPQLVILQMQENLTAGSTTPEEVAAGVAAIVNTLKGLYPQTEILLESALPEIRGERVLVFGSIETYNQLLKDFSKQDPKVHFLNLTEIFQDEPAQLIPNRFKPTAEAYTKWAEARAPIIEQVMSRSNSN
ncbi:GDSL-type esterase/lipase family protein [Coraliomargarita parva]|uniref:GDSL-type esterase/lipase family protein n=1 Tax=Coraliomargarita parva TaxID=3014050 RepID=UPI0022B4A45E|nr:GDSL-type esterase/lipase family protein [Coraliomargarita parva]